MTKKRMAALLLGLTSLIGSTLVAIQPAAAVTYLRIATVASDSSTGTRMCLTSGSVNGYTEAVDCNTTSYQYWAGVEETPGEVWISKAHPGYALAWTSLSTGAHLTMKKYSASDHTQLFYQGDPNGHSANKFRPYYAVTKCTEPRPYRTNYAIVYLEPCDQTDGGSQAFGILGG